jgi:hypothetical protein
MNQSMASLEGLFCFNGPDEKKPITSFYELEECSFSKGVFSRTCIEFNKEQVMDRINEMAQVQTHIDNIAWRSSIGGLPIMDFKYVNCRVDCEEFFLFETDCEQKNSKSEPYQGRILKIEDLIGGLK